MSGLRTVTGTIAGLIVLMFLPQVPGCVMANTPKAGRVVDVATGKGMPDVTVIAAATFNAGPVVHGSSHDTPYRIITHTDADGNYRIPNTWLHLKFGFPGTDARETWLVTAFKPGYALEGDEMAWREFDQYGSPKYPPRSVAESPPATWLGTVVRVEPLELRPVKLSLKEAAVYYRGIIVGQGGSYSDAPGEIALRAPGYEALTLKVCAENPDTKLDYATLSGLTALVLDEPAFLLRGSRFTPYVWPSEQYAKPEYQASEVCSAMKASGGSI